VRGEGPALWGELWLARGPLCPLPFLLIPNPGRRKMCWLLELLQAVQPLVRAESCPAWRRVDEPAAGFGLANSRAALRGE
jgi:hypothetical protein